MTRSDPIPESTLGAIMRSDLTFDRGATAALAYEFCSLPCVFVSNNPTICITCSILTWRLESLVGRLASGADEEPPPQTLARAKALFRQRHTIRPRPVPT